MEKGKVKRKEKEKEMTRQQKPFAQFISLSKTKKKRAITLNSAVIWLKFTLHVCMWFEKCLLTTNRKRKRKEKKKFLL